MTVLKKCKVDSCDRPKRRNGFCSYHNERNKKDGCIKAYNVPYIEYLENEKWIDIIGFEGYYKVSDKGRVYNCETGTVYKTTPSEFGYTTVRLKTNEKCKHIAVHRLVAEAFIPNPQNKETVDHIIPLSDGGTDEVTNLRWATRRENLLNEHTRAKRNNEKHHNYGKGKKIVCLKDGVFLKTYISSYEAGKILGINRCSISQHCRSKNHYYMGYEWFYEEDFLKMNGECENE